MKDNRKKFLIIKLINYSNYQINAVKQWYEEQNISNMKIITKVLIFP